MDYYKELKPTADKQVKEITTTISNLEKQIPKIQRRLQGEKDNGTRLVARMEKLNEIAPESLIADDGSYEKFKVSLKKLNNELVVSREIIKTLTDTMLPKAKNKLAIAKADLEATLENLVRSSCHIANDEMNTRLAEVDKCLILCLAEKQSFLNAFRQIFKDCGLEFEASDLRYYPGISNTEKLENLREKILLVKAGVRKSK